MLIFQSYNLGSKQFLLHYTVLPLRCISTGDGVGLGVDFVWNIHLAEEDPKTQTHYVTYKIPWPVCGPAGLNLMLQCRILLLMADKVNSMILTLLKRSIWSSHPESILEGLNAVKMCSPKAQPPQPPRFPCRAILDGPSAYLLHPCLWWPSCPSPSEWVT